MDGLPGRISRDAQPALFWLRVVAMTLAVMAALLLCVLTVLQAFA
jgi:hypothetical protein